MKRLTLTIVIVFVFAACGDDSTGDTAGTTVAAPTDTAADTTTTAGATTATTAANTTTTAAAATTTAPAGGLAITSVSFVADMAVVTNFGTEAVDLGGYWLCQRPGYAELPSVVLAPGEFVSINLGGSTVFLPIPGGQMIEGPLDVGGLEPASGELALYSSNSFGSSDAIVSYLEWGNSDHGRSSVAVGAGIWPEGGFVPTTPEVAAIFSQGQAPTGPDSYDAF